MPSGNTYFVAAQNDGVSYETVKFNVDTADAVDPQRVVLVAPYRHLRIVGAPICAHIVGESGESLVVVRDAPRRGLAIGGPRREPGMGAPRRAA
jgi:hypothetical protein